MKKIIYFMNVDWNWIKQRPHFIAEELAKRNDVTIVYKYRYNRSGFQKREYSKSVKPMFIIPMENKIPFVKGINRFLMKKIVGHQIKKKNADTLYLTYPDQIACVPDWFSGQIIYDCMDNHIAFEKHLKKKKLLKNQEALLTKRADFILVSAVSLKVKLLSNYGGELSDKISIIRNGYSGEVLPGLETAKIENDYFIISYFGTISSWFDFNLIQKSLIDFPNIRYELIGPVYDVVIPEHDRIVYKGTVEHDQLEKAVENTDCFIMPFVLNEIVEAVDPVKLYEYIKLNRNILCVEYDEIKRFESFVYFYSDYDSYKLMLDEIMKTKAPKYKSEEREEFLLRNSWGSRVKSIEELWR